VAAALYLAGSCRRWRGASRSADYSWVTEQRWRTRTDTRQRPRHQCSTTELPAQQNYALYAAWVRSAYVTINNAENMDL
jgi:hypothetical protein